MAQPSILRRRDVALYPLVLISLGAFALALSQSLRPAGQVAYGWSSPVIIYASLGFGVVVGLFAVSQDQGWIGRMLGALWFYVLGAGILIVALATAAILDRGLESVVYQAVMLVSCYIGFVFPPRLGRFAVAGLLAFSVLLQVARPVAQPLEVATILGLIVVSWAVGYLPRVGHRIAARHALLASRGDLLTGALDRRGFGEEFAYASQQAAAEGAPLGVLVLDLNGFKQVNDRFGHAAGDELLAWVGATIPTVLPPGSSLGRTGGDEFAVLLPGAEPGTALGVGQAIVTALSERTGVSVGAACAPNGQADQQTLLQTADRALYAAKRDPEHRAQIAAMPQGSEAPRPPRAAVRRPLLTFGELRDAGGPPEIAHRGAFDGRCFVAGFTIIAGAGLPTVVSNLMIGGDGFFEQVLRYLGIPWIVVNLAVGLYYRRLPSIDEPPRVGFLLSGFLVAGGVGAAALASGLGIAAPIMAAYVIKIMFDACLASPSRAREDLAIILGFWLVVVVCGPASSLWAAPFQLLLLGGAHLLGTISRAAFESGRMKRVELARTDSLTGLLNRAGLLGAAEQVLEASPTVGSFGVLTFDLDDFKGVNDTRGHAAGDQLLREIAALTVATLPAAFAVGRFGGDEFVAIVPVASPGELAAQVVRLDAGLEQLVGGSIGTAIHGRDGTTIEALLGVADARAYRVKQARPDRHLRFGTRARA